MGLAFPVADQADLCLEPLGTLDAVMLSQAREFLHGLGLLVLLQMTRGPEIVVNLVKISEMAG